MTVEQLIELKNIANIKIMMAINEFEKESGFIIDSIATEIDEGKIIDAYINFTVK